MDQRISMLNAYFIPCPRHWVEPIMPIPNETLQQNLIRLFSVYMPAIEGNQITILYISPQNNRTKPYCRWEVFFNHNLPLQRGIYEKLRRHLNQYKPRNTTIKLRAENEYKYIVTYNVECKCAVPNFYYPDEANKYIVEKEGFLDDFIKIEL